MKILVFGAGVIGTLYAARLHQAGHHVTVLARTSRLQDIRRYGLVIENVLTRTRSQHTVAIAEQLGAEDDYDLALVAVRADQLRVVLPVIAANRKIPTILFMLNNPLGSAALTEALGSDRLLLGFPGAGGTLEGQLVRYAMISQQPTMLGEPNCRHTARLRMVSEALRTSGFRTEIESDMNAWLCCHAFFVTSICGAIYLAGGNCERLSKSKPLLRLMVNGVREGFSAARTLRLPVRPLPLKVLFTWLPGSFAVYYWQRFFSVEIAEYVFARHARHAATEMQTIAEQCRVLLGRSGIATPGLDELYRAIGTYAAAHAIPSS